MVLRLLGEIGLSAPSFETVDTLRDDRMPGEFFEGDFLEVVGLVRAVTDLGVRTDVRLLGRSTDCSGCTSVNPLGFLGRLESTGGSVEVFGRRATAMSWAR